MAGGRQSARAPRDAVRPHARDGQVSLQPGTRILPVFFQNSFPWSSEHRQPDACQARGAAAWAGSPHPRPQGAAEGRGERTCPGSPAPALHQHSPGARPGRRSPRVSESPSSWGGGLLPGNGSSRDSFIEPDAGVAPSPEDSGRPLREWGRRAGAGRGACTPASGAPAGSPPAVGSLLLPFALRARARAPGLGPCLSLTGAELRAL